MRIYPTSNCSGTPIGTGHGGRLQRPPASPPPCTANQTTNLRATATDAAGNVSGCSAPFAVRGGLPGYRHADPRRHHSRTRPRTTTSPRCAGRLREVGSTVRIYSTSDCTGTPIGTGPAATFNGATGITATVASEPDHQPARDRDGRGRERVRLLVRAPLHRGLPGAGRAHDHRHRPRPPRRTTTTRRCEAPAPRPARPSASTRPRTAPAPRSAPAPPPTSIPRPGSPHTVLANQTHQPARDGHRRGRQRLGLLGARTPTSRTRPRRRRRSRSPSTARCTGPRPTTRAAGRARRTSAAPRRTRGGAGLATVEVRIQRQSDDQYWNGTSWQAGESYGCRPPAHRRGPAPSLPATTSTPPARARPTPPGTSGPSTARRSRSTPPPRGRRR